MECRNKNDNWKIINEVQEYIQSGKRKGMKMRRCCSSEIIYRRELGFNKDESKRMVERKLNKCCDDNTKEFVNCREVGIQIDMNNNNTGNTIEKENADYDMENQENKGEMQLNENELNSKLIFTQNEKEIQNKNELQNSDKYLKDEINEHNKFPSETKNSNLYSNTEIKTPKKKQKNEEVIVDKSLEIKNEENSNNNQNISEHNENIQSTKPHNDNDNHLNNSKYHQQNNSNTNNGIPLESDSYKKANQQIENKPLYHPRSPGSFLNKTMEVLGNYGNKKFLNKIKTDTKITSLHQPSISFNISQNSNTFKSKQYYSQTETFNKNNPMSINSYSHYRNDKKENTINQNVFPKRKLHYPFRTFHNENKDEDLYFLYANDKIYKKITNQDYHDYSIKPIMNDTEHRHLSHIVTGNNKQQGQKVESEKMECKDNKTNYVSQQEEKDPYTYEKYSTAHKVTYKPPQKERYNFLKETLSLSKKTKDNQNLTERQLAYESLNKPIRYQPNNTDNNEYHYKYCMTEIDK